MIVKLTKTTKVNKISAVWNIIIKYGTLSGSNTVFS